MNCNKCGHSINKEDIYCRFCGNKIGKITKCVVCNSDIFSDAQTCLICGSKQSDYVKCATCNELNKSSNKYCIGCGNLLTSKPRVQSSKEEEPIKKEYKSAIPTPTPQAQDNTVYKEKNNNSKAPLIIAICAACLALAAVAVVTYFSFFKNNSNEQYIDSSLEDELQQIIEEYSEDSIPEEIIDTYYYYNIQFIDTVKVREQPSTDAKQVGKITKGSTKVGFSMVENGGYQWYQIGYNEWVANDGSFLYVSDYITDEEYVIEYRDTVKVNVTKDTGVYDGPGYEYSCTGWMIATSKFQVSDSIQNDKGEYWLKLSPCEYVPLSNTEYIYD